MALFAAAIIKKIILLTVAVDLISCNLFYRGLRFHQKNIEKIEGIEDQYYDQRLDHFNEAVTTTWRQV